MVINRDLKILYVLKTYHKRKFNVEAGSNTSTVALRVVEGDEKGTQCLGV
jgi:hypothetical protein